MKNLKCINREPLPNNNVAPPVELGKVYELKEIFVCECGQEHFDVGLVSKFNWVSCYACKKPIPGGDVRHWCHPTRFVQA